MLYESFKLDYRAYFESGLKTAQWIVDICMPRIVSVRPHILDWGCGPARVTQHIPQLVPDAIVHGSDYNRETIDWCQRSFKNIHFSVNQLGPPTDYAPDTFDLIYGISIFTHLSERNHTLWLEELQRILSPQGLALLTTHGDAHMKKLTSAELAQYRESKMVFRKGEKEGHRTCTSFHPPAVFARLVEKYFIVLKHEPGHVHEWGIGQDVWLLTSKSLD